MTTEYPVSGATLRRIWLDDEPDGVGIRAGRFSAVLVGDSLSDIRFDGRPVLTAIRFVVRDQDWATVPSDVIEVNVEAATTAGANTGKAPAAETTAGIRVTIRARTGHAPDLEWTASVELVGDRLRMTATATVLRSFRRNRIGIVLLHPASCAGAELTVRHPAGRTQTRFPCAIAPHQPAVDIAGLEWLHDGVRTRVDLEGETFEMEDQRNWTDASFKTYGTPLSEPFPVEAHPGERIVHTVTLTCTALPMDTADAHVAQRADSDDGALMTLRPAGRRMPDILVGASTAPDADPAADADTAADADPAADAAQPTGLRPPWLGVGVLVELRILDDNWPAALQRAAHEAGAGVLDVRIVASDVRDVRTVIAVLCAPGAPRVHRLGVYSLDTSITEPDLWDALVVGADALPHPVELVGGARAHFTELNRTHTALPSGLPALTFSTTPQMHDIGRTQVIAALDMQRLVADQAVALASGRPVHVGPVTLRSRFNAVATTPPNGIRIPDLRHGYGAHAVSGSTDPRQFGWGYAAWLLASASALCVDGVASLTFAESWGPRGFLDASGRFPASWAIEWLTGIAGKALLTSERPANAVAVLGAHDDEGTVVLFANASVQPVDLGVQIPGAAAGHLERLRPGSARPQREPCDAREGVVRIRIAPGEIARWQAAPA